MNAERLLAHYERIADAPDAIQRLRRFVLDLAVRGKLVPQDANDEPAAQLLKRIAAAKERTSRKERRKKPHPKIHSPKSVVMVELPSGWAHAPMSDLVTVLNGRAYKQSELLDRGTPVLRVGNLFTSDKWYYSDLHLDNDKYCDEGDLIFAWSASFGPFIWTGERVIYHYHIWKLQLHSDVDLDKLYLYNFLLQKTREIKDSGHGISMIHMTKEKMEQIDVLLPPIAEQHRIVAKVDELMSLCDRLEATRAEREATRDRLAAASFERLKAPDHDTFYDDARFALDALPTLTTRPDQIKQLRKTILNVAVRGKLVPQDLNDEPGYELLKRLAADRVRLIKGAKTRRPQELAPPTSEEMPFPLPATWSWARFVEVAAIQSNLVNPRGYESYPHIAPDNIEGGTGRLLPYETIGQSGVFSSKHLFAAGCLLYSKIRPALAKVTAVDFEGLCSADMYPLRSFICRSYLKTFMLSEVFVRQSISEDNRVAMPKINQGSLSKILVAVPPLAEQHRIAAKVDELMALCDRLEASLATGSNARRRLLDALLHDALSPLQQFAAPSETNSVDAASRLPRAVDGCAIEVAR